MSPVVPQEPDQRGLAIPENVDAALTLCLSMNIPNDPTYIEHILGTLAELGSGWLYQNDPGLNAGPVARKWKQALQTIAITEGACMPPIQLRACTLDCGIEYSTDGGENWTCISLANCIGDLVQSGIQDLLSDGTLQGGTGQQGPQPAPAPGECRTYHVRMNARDRWLCPNPISSSDTVHITNAKGGWWDGGGVRWECPNGKYFIAGICGNDVPSQPSDPLPAGKHMQLIGAVGTDYGDPLGGTWSVPTGHLDDVLYIQANDSPLSDNQGEVEFDVTVCTGAWCHQWDFTASAGGDASYPFSIHPVGGVNFGTYVAGQGYRGVGGSAVWVRSNSFIPSCAIVSVQMDETLVSVTQNHNEIYDDPALGFDANWFAATGNGDILAAHNEVGTIPANQYLWFGTGVTGGSVTIKRLRLYGRGANPFGSNNC